MKMTTKDNLFNREIAWNKIEQLHARIKANREAINSLYRENERLIDEAIKIREQMDYESIRTELELYEKGIMEPPTGTRNC